jgi:uncharacterized membrane protein (UPF0127 family)
MHMYIHTRINQDIFKTKVLISDKEREKGMMGKTFNSGFSAALFVMNANNNTHNNNNNPINHNIRHSFWMAGCIIPLDIIFVKNGKITGIHHSCPPCTSAPCRRYSGVGDYVIEMPGGTCKKMNIKRNAAVDFYRI